MFASKLGHLRCVELLVQYGANVNLLDKTKKNAVIYSKTKEIKKLLRPISTSSTPRSSARSSPRGSMRGTSPDKGTPLHTPSSTSKKTAFNFPTPSPSPTKSNDKGNNMFLEAEENIQTSTKDKTTSTEDNTSASPVQSTNP
jgi:hypothetical protein